MTLTRVLVPLVAALSLIIGNTRANAQRRLTNQEGLDFLQGKAGEAGAVTLESGIVYKVQKEGNKGATPGPTDTVELHFRAKSIKGQEVDSTYSRGSTQTVVINQHSLRGFREILPLMTEDAKWEVYIPSELAFGRRGAGRLIGPNEVVVCTIHLLKIMSEKDKRRQHDGNGGGWRDERGSRKSKRMEL